MGHHARGDCKKLIYTSEEEDSYQNYTTVTTNTIRMMSRLHLHHKRFNLPSTSGEAPPVPIPPISDDTDRQFWAEDELSSTESKQHMLIRRKRRRNLTYRNRTSVYRSRSVRYYSSSSSSDPIDQNIPPSVLKRRRRYLLRKGLTTGKMTKGDRNVTSKQEKTSCSSSRLRKSTIDSNFLIDNQNPVLSKHRMNSNTPTNIDKNLSSKSSLSKSRQNK
ncbi:uncharacterized protein LOC107263123 isoform X2 [Cephus cinctus]|uniref:Uncharacterized protein LOC107263123 isoform X2 n=1 Tax=Cephus cinctus TaxID=211228 RepID=A0AAJ7R8K3_CEPCN|nr:uncharacterized protein LOC107263123 isoform X2 [Cephus cinctus]